MNQILSIIRKDVRQFLADKGGAITAIAVPIGIATFLTLINVGGGGSSEPKPVPVVACNLDDSTGSQELMRRLGTDTRLKLTPKASADEVRSLVKEGKFGAGLVIPKGFFDQSRQSLITSKDKPTLELIEDPSQRISVMAAQGIIQGTAVSTVLDNGSTLSPADEKVERHLPFEIKEEAMKGEEVSDAVATKSHVFAGMAVQGALFFAINLAMGMIRERRTGVWKRLRTAPVSPATLLLGRLMSGTALCGAIFTTVLLFGALVFGIRIAASPLALVVVILASSMMCSGLGLLIASLGKTEEQSRGLSVGVVLALSMLGGAWFPTFMMPQWFQSATMFIPSRWAVDGFDGVLWRGLGFGQMGIIVGCLGLFTALFFGLALSRIRSIEAKM